MADNIMHDRMVALADCNNFFVSCERLADPDLQKRPVVVLSCNDGCIISRSNEVKKLGVKMGDPYFKVKHFLAANGVIIRSSNMSLYRDVSAQVMSCIGSYTDVLEVYSIDESFFNMGIASIDDPVKYCGMIRENIRKKCGIPLSIGIAPTKTLCKLATEYAKKHDETGGIFWFDSSRYKDMRFMERFSCEDIWGIGRRTSSRLMDRRIRTAADFIRQGDEMSLKKNFGVSALYTLWELRGHPVYSISPERKAPKSIQVSRSFGVPLTSYEELLDPLLCFAVAAAKQLRKAKQAAGRMSVYITSGRFVQDGYYADSREMVFSEPKFLDVDFIAAARELLGEIFAEGYKYRKCGVTLHDLSDISCGVQTALFGQDSDSRQLKAISAVDAINTRYGKVMIRPAILCEPENTEKKWAPKSEYHRDSEDNSSRVKDTETAELPDGLRFHSHAADYLP